MRASKWIIRLRLIEDNKSQYGKSYPLEYSKDAPKYNKNGNKENFTLGVVGFSERIFQFIESVNISYCAM